MWGVGEKESSCACMRNCRNFAAITAYGTGASLLYKCILQSRFNGRYQIERGRYSAGGIVVKQWVLQSSS